METPRVNGTPDPQPRYCPHCQQVLQVGRRILLRTAMVTGTAYICRQCRIIYLPDLKPLARLSGGMN